MGVPFLLGGASIRCAEPSTQTTTSKKYRFSRQLPDPDVQDITSLIIESVSSRRMKVSPILAGKGNSLRFEVSFQFGSLEVFISKTVSESIGHIVYLDAWGNWNENTIASRKAFEDNWNDIKVIVAEGFAERSKRYELVWETPKEVDMKYSGTGTNDSSHESL